MLLGSAGAAIGVIIYLVVVVFEIAVPILGFGSDRYQGATQLTY